jgi:transposase
MSRRHELSDQEWDLIKDLLPRNEGVGRHWEDHRRILNGMFWIVRTGAPWRDVPERYGPWQTIFDRFNRWRKNGTLDRMLERLQIRLDEDGKLDWDLWCIDGSSIRASRAAAGAGKRGAPKSPKTTLWAARAADLGQNSTWFVTAEAIPSPLTSRRDKSTSRRPSKKS